MPAPTRISVPRGGASVYGFRYGDRNGTVQADPGDFASVQVAGRSQPVDRRSQSEHLVNRQFRGVSMIVSASYKTDIPAFYGDWFMARLEAGFALVANPWGGKPFRVELGPGAVSGFVFWTRNIEPFLGHLAEIRRRGLPFVVQFTATGYPRALESSVIGPEQAAAQVRALAESHGPRAVVWRYDPVLISDLTPPDKHLAVFGALANALEGAVDEAVISFAHIYKKTRRNLDRAAAREGFRWRDPGLAEKRELAAELAGIAASRGMRLTICAQPDHLAGEAAAARCIDAERLSDIAGRPIEAREKGNRPGCKCHQSRDIGAYDTCPHGCVYCYAVSDREAARERFKAHDPAGEFLFPPPARAGMAGSGAPAGGSEIT